jgi:hypothetical protein
LSVRVRELDPAPDEDFNDGRSTRMECGDEDGSDPE